MLGGVSILAEISTEQTWWVVTVLVSLLIAVGGFLVRQMWTQNQELRSEMAKLEDQQEAERHASVIRGIEDVKAETRGLRNEVHAVTDRVGKVERRVETIERTIRPEGAR